MGACICQRSDQPVEDQHVHYAVQPLSLSKFNSELQEDSTPSTVFSPHCCTVRISKQQFTRTYSTPADSVYSFEEQLGTGAYGIVTKGKHRITGQLVAIKSVASDKPAVLQEIEILKTLDHPNILKVYEIFTEPEETHIVTELCAGGTLCEKLKECPSEHEIKQWMKQVISALVHCHSRGVVHRDLKPENVLFDSSGQAKLIDFGVSVNVNGTLSAVAGTIYYMAPEVVNQAYTEQCDMWSCGVLLYLLLSGQLPFKGNTREEIFSSITRGVFTFQHPNWGLVSRPAKNLVSSLLKKNPEERMTALEAYAHPWFAEVTAPLSSWNFLDIELGPTLRRAVFSFIMYRLVPAADVQPLVRIFYALDRDGDGRLTKEDLDTVYDGQFGVSLTEVFNSCDLNKTEFIEYNEFLTATYNWRQNLREEWAKRAFKFINTSHSGTITLEEVKEFINDMCSDDEWENLLHESNLEQGNITWRTFKNLLSI